MGWKWVRELPKFKRRSPKRDLRSLEPMRETLKRDFRSLKRGFRSLKPVRETLKWELRSLKRDPRSLKRELRSLKLVNKTLKREGKSLNLEDKMNYSCLKFSNGYWVSSTTAFSKSLSCDRSIAWAGTIARTNAFSGNAIAPQFVSEERSHIFFSWVRCVDWVDARKPNLYSAKGDRSNRC